MGLTGVLNALNSLIEDHIRENWLPQQLDKATRRLQEVQEETASLGALSVSSELFLDRLCAVVSEKLAELDLKNCVSNPEMKFYLSDAWPQLSQLKENPTSEDYSTAPVQDQMAREGRAAHPSHPGDAPTFGARRGGDSRDWEEQEACELRYCSTAVSNVVPQTEGGGRTQNNAFDKQTKVINV